MKGFKKWLENKMVQQPLDLDTLSPELRQLGFKIWNSIRSGETDMNMMSMDLQNGPPEFPQAGSNFDAHGMAKCQSPHECLNDLNNILTNGLGNVYTAPLEVPPGSTKFGASAGNNTRGGNAYRDGPFILVSSYGQPLADGVKYVVVNEPYYKNGGLEVLQRLYPNVKFIPSPKAPEFFIDVAKQSQGQGQGKQQVKLGDILMRNGIMAVQQDGKTLNIPDKNVKLRIGTNSLSLFSADGRSIKSVSLNIGINNALTDIINTIRRLP